jgi:N-acetylglucosamine-6-phosphate deacetylase
VSEVCVWAPRALTPDRALERVRIVAQDGRITGLESDCAPRADDTVFADATLVPGLVDLQANGALGIGFDDADPARRARAAAWHANHGTTSLLATLVSAPLDSLVRALERLAGDVDPAGPVVGVHLEGPFLAPEKCGAHDARVLVDPRPEHVERVLASARGGLRLVTLAPERPGALDAIERFARAGAVVAAGHSLATLSDVRAAIARGLSFVTHVGNASDWPSRRFDPALRYRASEPGLVGAFMLERRLAGSVILDGAHLHPELVRALVELRGADAVALVSDATPSVGLPPGRYRAGALEVELRPDGVAVAGEGLAGSAIPLLDAVRVAVRRAGLPLDSAVRMATATPARVAGIADRKGRLAPGLDADWCLLGPDLALAAAYRRGQRLPATAARGA